MHLVVVHAMKKKSPAWRAEAGSLQQEVKCTSFLAATSINGLM
jgi:hypothetical protein